MESHSALQSGRPAADKGISGPQPFVLRMRSSRHLLLPCTAVALALPATSHAAPKIVSAEVVGNPLVGQPLRVVVTASDDAKAITGFALEAPNGDRFEESACGLTRTGKPNRKGAFAPGRVVEFDLPYTPRAPGIQVINTKVTAGGCGDAPESSSSRLAVTVTPPTVPAPASTANPFLPGVGLPIARASRTARAAASCGAAKSLAAASNHALMRSAIMCLMNAERRARGLSKLRTARKLRDAAIFHSSDMARRGYFSHSGPGGPDLAGRLKRFGFWPAVAGENLGRATGGGATPAAMVAAWMRSEPHRVNILTPSFKNAGIGVAPARGGAYFTVDFGRR